MNWPERFPRSWHSVDDCSIYFFEMVGRYQVYHEARFESSMGLRQISSFSSPHTQHHHSPLGAP